MPLTKKNLNHTNNIDTMLSQIVNEKEKLDKLSKTVLSPQQIKHTMKNNTNNNNHIKIINNSNVNNKGVRGAEALVKGARGAEALATIQADMEGEANFTKQFKIKSSDFKNISPETMQKVLDLISNYVKMDKTFRVKHESLKTLYSAYLELYKKYKSEQSAKGGINITGNGTDNKATPSNPEHEEVLKNIHTEMKDNNTNLYRERLLILKKIKETPEIDPETKNQICGKLLVVFKSPPISEYTQKPMMEPTEEKISVKELDDAYLQKHNELMTVYKAYQNLFSKVLHYKEQLDKYKQLPTGSNISRCQMENLIKDQGFVMNMIDKMQDQLVSNNIISNSEKVPVSPVTSHPENIGMFNDTMRDQIKHIIDRQVDVKPDMKAKIENLLTQYKDCDSNDKFCQSGRKLLMIRKM